MRQRYPYPRVVEHEKAREAQQIGAGVVAMCPSARWWTGGQEDRRDQSLVRALVRSSASQFGNQAVRTILREPLLHFLAIGAALFAAYAVVGRGADSPQNESARTVRITANDIDWLRQSWMRQFNQPPDEEQLRGLVADHLREELLGREARELGLDEDDIVVRRRLAQKMSFLLDDTAALAAPVESELFEFYQAHADLFRTLTRLDLVQVYFSRDKRGPQAESDARAALEALRSSESPDPTEFGDSTLLPSRLSNVDEAALAAQFGQAFAQTVINCEPNLWTGPTESEFGWHLFLVQNKEEGRLRDFADARGEIEEEWRRGKQKSLSDEYMAALLKKYDVVVDESVRPLLRPAAEAMP